MSLDINKLKKGLSISLNEAMDLSLKLAKKGLGLVEPNPCVGSVLYDETKKELISWGYHEYFGGPHAEVNCLKDIKTAKGLTLIVSLEPCSHFGKTPPCADLVIEKEVSKLIYIDLDPNPLVSGRGLERIKNTGIQVEPAPIEFSKDHQILNAPFMYAFKNKKSYVHLKWAQDEKGSLSYKNQTSQITSKESQLNAHFLRAQSQMVLVGVNTILQDDPRLNVRLKGYEKDLMVGVLDPELKLLKTLKNQMIYKIRPKGTVFLISNQKVKEPGHIQVSKTSEGFLDLGELREKTYSDYAVQSLFVEGGASTLKSFIDQKVFNRLSVYESKKSLDKFETVRIFKTKNEYDSFVDKNLKVVEEKRIQEDLLKDYIRK